MATYMTRCFARVCTSPALKYRPLLQTWTTVHLKPLQCAYCSRILKAESDRVIATTSDESTIVCYHPTEAYPYQHTKPMPRPDPAKPEEGAESMLRMKMNFTRWEKEQHGPSIRELSSMFYTTKHRWFPVGIRKLLTKRSKNAPRERPYM
ncbi:large ribosomal subunit protein mL42-like [Amphiura filiformis]|uniref:large ribosomal subunit protein mL42-like n=1 Tax=Amphiura filiformis TaxID=82378 RepID=UPI003B21E77D